MKRCKKCKHYKEYVPEIGGCSCKKQNKWVHIPEELYDSCKGKWWEKK